MFRPPPGGRCGGWGSETWLMGCIRSLSSRLALISRFLFHLCLSLLSFRFLFHFCLSLLSFLRSPLCAISSPFLVLCLPLPSRLSSFVSHVSSVFSSVFAPGSSLVSILFCLRFLLISRLSSPPCPPGWRRAPLLPPRSPVHHVW